MKSVTQDPVHRRILQGTQAAAWVAVERARQTGTPLIVWKNGKVAELSPDDPSLTHPAAMKPETAPKRLHQN